MTFRTIAGLGLAATLLATLGGCKCCHHNSPPYPYDHPRPYNPTAPRPGGTEILPPEPLPPGGGGGAPPLPAPASSGFGVPSAPNGSPAPLPRDLLPPTQVPVDARYYAAPRVIDRSEPPLAPVNPPAKADKPADPRPLPPDLLDPQSSAKVPLPKGLPDPAATPPLPVGIVGFLAVMDQVSTGQKPDPEGLEWLQINGYKTVVHLRRPGAPHTADKEQVEKRGMKYLSLEVSGQTLTASLAAEFSRAVADRSSRPLFVYDKDGTLAGAIWYTYLRAVEKLPAVDAKKRAVEFGLKPAATGEHADLWSAAQRITQE